MAFLPFFTYSQPLDGSKTELNWDDLAHQNQGCPENSQCSKEMGKKIQDFKNFLARTQNESNFSNQLENYRLKNGIPVKFLIQKESPTLDPVVWDSRCSLHRTKKISQGLLFFQNNPKSPLVQFDPIYFNDVLYEIPHGEQPLLIKNDEIVITTEFEDHYFYLSINKNGNWKVITLSSEEIQKALQANENTECSSESKISTEPFYANTFCKKIWDVTRAQLQTVELAWSCP